MSEPGSKRRLMPKSMSLTSASLRSQSKRMFSILMSRCTTFLLWQYTMALMILKRIRPASRS
eukprot:1699406-Alexandrium_andersonii.AAC.1